MGNPQKYGIKHDNDKPMMNLIPPHAEIELARVLTFGATKYGPENWRTLENLETRYVAAAMRHINAFRQGETLDSESGLHHLAHAMCCMAFIVEKNALDLCCTLYHNAGTHNETGAAP